jgi:hypothetical protein
VLFNALKIGFEDGRFPSSAHFVTLLIPGFFQLLFSLMFGGVEIILALV